MTTNRPLVSIISPSLNSRLYLPRLLACVSHQTYQPIEHIIVDGQSTDGSHKLFKTIDPGKHRVIVRRDQSMYEAINRGIKSSRGEIIGYLNVDDLYFPNTVEVVVNCLAKRPLADIVFGDVISIDERKKSFVFYCYGRHQFSLSRLALDQSIGQPSVFFRRRVIDKIGLFDDRLRLVADFEYWMRASKHRLHFQKINQFLSLDCRHAGMLREQRGGQLAEELNRVRRRYFWYPAWQKAFFSRRNYWENIIINKLLEYTAGRRFSSAIAGQVFFNQSAYRQAWHRARVDQSPILFVQLPYFRFEGTRLDTV